MSPRPRIEVLHGVNLDMLGRRDPAYYGSQTLHELEVAIAGFAVELGFEARFFQTNHEGVLIDWVQEGRRDIAGMVVNAAGYTHTSVALRDAMSAVTVPRVEVHISDIAAREEFRHHSYLTDVTDLQVIGRGVAGYVEAIQWVVAQHHG